METKYKTHRILEVVLLYNHLKKVCASIQVVRLRRPVGPVKVRSEGTMWEADFEEIVKKASR